MLWFYVFFRYSTILNGNKLLFIHIYLIGLTPVFNIIPLIYRLGIYVTIIPGKHQCETSIFFFKLTNFDWLLWTRSNNPGFQPVHCFMPIPYLNLFSPIEDSVYNLSTNRTFVSLMQHMTSAAAKPSWTHISYQHFV